MATADMPTDGTTAAAAANSSASGRAKSRNPLSLSIASSALLFLGLVLGNVALARTSTRVDLTNDRLFTLSDATRTVLKGLTDPAKISVYWGDKIPARAETVRRRLEGLLGEYAAESAGRLEVVWVKMDDAGRDEAQKRNIHEGNFQELDTNTVSEAHDFEGLAISYESKTERLGPLLEVSDDQQSYQLNSSLEYELTSTLYKVSRTRKAVVGLVRSAPPPAFMRGQGPVGDDRFSVLAEGILSKVYGDDFRDSVSLDSPIPADFMVLVVPAPKDLTEKQAYHLEQFVLRGGKALLLLDPLGIRQAWGQEGAPPTKSGLEDWLTSVGVTLSPGVVGDFDPKYMGAAATQDGVARYPFIVSVLKDQLNQDNPGTRDFSSVPFYFPSEVVVDAQKQAAAGRDVTVLATTSDTGYLRKSTDGLATIRIAIPDDKELGKKTLLVAISGPFTSYWKGKPAPDEKPPEPPASPAPLPTEPAMGDAPAMDAGPAMDSATPPAPSMGAPPVPLPESPKGPEIPKAPELPPASTTASKSPPAPKGPDAPKPPDTPKAPDAPKSPEAPMGAKGPEGGGGMDGAVGKDAGPARLDTGRGLLLVAGDAELVSDDFSGGRKDITQGVTRMWTGVNGFKLVNNLVDWMTGSDELLALRTRGSAVRKLEEVPKETAGTIEIVNYVAAPLLVLIAGILVFVVRKYRS